MSTRRLGQLFKCRLDSSRSHSPKRNSQQSPTLTSSSDRSPHSSIPPRPLPTAALASPFTEISPVALCSGGLARSTARVSWRITRRISQKWSAGCVFTPCATKRTACFRVWPSVDQLPSAGPEDFRTRPASVPPCPMWPILSSLLSASMEPRSATTARLHGFTGLGVYVPSTINLINFAATLAQNKPATWDSSLFLALLPRLVTARSHIS